MRMWTPVVQGIFTTLKSSKTSKTIEAVFDAAAFANVPQDTKEQNENFDFSYDFFVPLALILFSPLYLADDPALSFVSPSP